MTWYIYWVGFTHQSQAAFIASHSSHAAQKSNNKEKHAGGDNNRGRDENLYGVGQLRLAIVRGQYDSTNHYQGDSACLQQSIWSQR